MGDTLYKPMHLSGTDAADSSAYCNHFALSLRRKHEEASFE